MPKDASETRQETVIPPLDEVQIGSTEPVQSAMAVVRAASADRERREREKGMTAAILTKSAARLFVWFAALSATSTYFGWKMTTLVLINIGAALAALSVILCLNNGVIIRTARRSFFLKRRPHDMSEFLYAMFVVAVQGAYTCFAPLTVAIVLGFHIRRARTEATVNVPVHERKGRRPHGENAFVRRTAEEILRDDRAQYLQCVMEGCEALNDLRIRVNRIIYAVNADVCDAGQWERCQSYIGRYEDDRDLLLRQEDYLDRVLRGDQSPLGAYSPDGQSIESASGALERLRHSRQRAECLQSHDHGGLLAACETDEVG